MQSWSSTKVVGRLAAAGLALFASLATAQAAVPVYGYEIKHSYPHDPQAFTQGLLFQNGILYESTGLNGRSSVRKVALETGKVLQKTDIPAQFFGEGITAVGNVIIGLTWTSQTGFIFDSETLQLKQTFSYPGEGWALATDGERLYMSDGTAYIRVLDPKTMQQTRRIRVTADGEPVTQINELEWVEGQIYANIWQTDKIARIDPFSGRVMGWIDLSGLAAKAGIESGSDNVLNGIAYDSAKRRLFVTGKLWPKLFEIELKRK
ncbi:glutaminyl-peptide cyclotransferase [Pseudoduganella aquatica]|uniref:Glutaminyl-peptide cyclotransferase n=1 Tax=Pseudoduganella aquatica TaxID=2660641 RepID=A0A7X4H9W9_9BURK|nr:glutaminyl-peptide cyclotransferase [Pseudoduganella aquatica]MYN07319.1 glutaminyl-peptide cyclotransferase [Pseudoduganella aquatica]